VYHLRLLGTPRLENPSGALILERKTAAVLAYLALEGATLKYKLAGWLWPDSGETAARNNMRQLLRRLRVAAGDIVRGEEHIALSDDVRVDAQQLSALQTPALEALRDDADLLQDLEYDDAPDFEEWLLGVREEFRAQRSQAASNEAHRLEQAGQFGAALEYAQVRVRLEPLSEEGYRQVARLQYLMGERSAALSTLERCQTVLRDELGIEPLPETLELLTLLERGGNIAGATPKSKDTALPTAILRPPVLAGREREWAALEQAWARGQMIYLEGEPGAGKTRLALDFAASKGKVFHFQARPGDAQVPLATQARAMRAVLAQEPQILAHLPTWARRELTRLLPEIATEDPLPALASEADKLRFFEAIGEVTLAQSANITVVDDVQFSDLASAQSSGYLLSKFAANPAPGNPRLIMTFRRGELRPEVEFGLNTVLESGLAVKIAVEPLEDGAITSLLSGLGLADAEHLTPGMARYTGGNPLFILETLKHLIETDTLAQGLPSRLTPPGKVAALVGRRLARLSVGALNLARAAAVAKTAFDLKLAAFVLERPAMELAEAHAELEAAQVLRGNAFVHDLIFEATLAGIPSAVAQVLNARTAQHLETVRANPALIAQHWLTAGEDEHGARWLLKAADEAHALGLFDDAVRLYERVLELTVDADVRLQTQVGLTFPLLGLSRLDEAEGLARSVLSSTRDPLLRSKVLYTLQTVLMWRGQHDEAQAAISQALHLAEQIGDETLADEMRFAQGLVLSYLGHDAHALETLEPLLPRFRARPLGFKRLHLFSVLGSVYSGLGHFEESKTVLLEAFEGARQMGSASNQILAASELQLMHNNEGRPELGFARAEEALTLGDYLVAQLLRSNLAHGYLLAERPADAVPHLEWLTAHAQDPSIVSLAWARLARARAALNLPTSDALQQALASFDPSQVPSAHLAVAGVALEHGNPEQQRWGEAQLSSLDLGKLSASQRGEYERLRALTAS
jgi:DNA-binding SARP family transcriptional activator